MGARACLHGVELQLWEDVPVHSYFTVTSQLRHSYVTVTSQLRHGETQLKTRFVHLQINNESVQYFFYIENMNSYYQLGFSMT